jgi:uracil-DNA glycosylase family 4
VTEAERRAALEEIAAEVRACDRCRLHERRTNAVPGEGHPSTEVVFVGEGPGFNEDRLGRPFVGRAGDLLVRHLGSVGWRRDEVFITNIVKCRPPENRDPEPDEIAACAPFLRRQLEVLDPALIVTLGRHSMGRFMPGARISQAHGTVRPADPETGASDAMVFAMYHPAAALRSTDVERQSYEDMGRVPQALEEARRRRTERHTARVPGAEEESDSAPELATSSPSGRDAEISPPRLSGPEGRPDSGNARSDGRQLQHDPAVDTSPELVVAAVGIASGIAAAARAPVNHPRDIPGGIPAPAGALSDAPADTVADASADAPADASALPSDPSDPADPSNQLPLF